MPEIQIPSIVTNLLSVIIAFFSAFAIALWISMIIWTFRDARARSRDFFAVALATLMVVIFGPLGLLLYFLLRPSVTLAELYERSLEEEALLQDLEERPRCPGCSRVVENEWVICPDCHTQLKRICVNCSNKLHLRWNLCPYCGTGVNQAATSAQIDRGRPNQHIEEPKREAAPVLTISNRQPTTAPHQPVRMPDRAHEPKADKSQSAPDTKTPEKVDTPAIDSQSGGDKPNLIQKIDPA
jgi:RNA polymerase subunit RPABC4/transcription elongation factor Spt4